MNSKMLKIVGWIATGVGAIATLVSDYIDEKQMEQEIHDRVAEEIEKALPARSLTSKAQISFNCKSDN